MQEGRRPTLDARPMQSVGKGVFELKDADDATWYRMLYLARSPGAYSDTIYVLDCFTKNTRKTGSNTLNKARPDYRASGCGFKRAINMAKANQNNKPGHITHGDVLEDLGFTAEEFRETEIKMTLWRPLRAEIEGRRLTQAEVAGLLEIHQPDASLLVRGKLSKFSVMKLMQFADNLGLTVRLTVKPASAVRHVPPVRGRSSAPAAKRGWAAAKTAAQREAVA
jgi:predicted XRE-type DNA-binding protein